MKPEFLLPCDHVWGKARLISAEPNISLECGMIYVPFDPGGVWGIFDRSGAAPDGTLDRYGADCALHHQSIEYTPPDPSAPANAPENEYIYGGQIHYHFGHFFINTLSRLWPEFIAKGRRSKILVHGPGSVEDWFSHDFVRDVFSAMGLTVADVVKFDHPVIIPRLIVPFPAFQDVNFVHAVFGRLCRKIGERILWHTPRKDTNRPVYVSKSGTAISGWDYSSEQEIISILMAKGIEVVVPEMLSLGEKARLFEERRCVCGFASSGMHSAIFAPPKARGVFLNAFSGMNANFYMFDLINKQKTEYFYAPGTTVDDSRAPHERNRVIVAEPARVAQDLLTLIE